MTNFTPAELEAFLDEELAPAEMAAVEQQLRAHPELGEQLSEIVTRREAGIHSLGGIWRSHRLSCPSRDQLGSYLLQALSPEEMAYIEFHIEVIGCRYCQASLDDLRTQQEEAAEAATTRRRRYFQSSAGYLNRGEQ